MQEAADPGHAGCTRLATSSDVAGSEQARVVTSETQQALCFLEVSGGASRAKRMRGEFVADEVAKGCPGG